jgi:segregation and condensation protein B
MRREVEALLFASDQPLTIARIAAFFPGVDRKALQNTLDELREEYDRDQHAFTIVEFGGGYSISTRPEHAKFVRELFRGRRKIRLSKPALECLAIIAYKQPVTRLEVEEIRGVSVQGVLGTLLERDLVQIVGRAQSLGNPLLYGTTKSFLDYMGLAHLRELPQLAELEDILAQKEELKQLAMNRDAELSDEDFEAALEPDASESAEDHAAAAESLPG